MFDSVIDQVLRGMGYAGAIFWSGVVLFAIVQLLGA